MSILDELGERDWTQNPYTKEEFLNSILMRYQRSGIDPFFAKKPAELPAEGSAFKDSIADLVVGNIIEGIPGVEIKSDGNIHYKHKGPVDTSGSWDTLVSGIDDQTLWMFYQNWIENPTGYIPILAKTNLSDFGVKSVSQALSSGTHSNLVLYAPGAGKKFCIHYIDVFTTLADFDHVFNLTWIEETTGTLFECTWNPGAGPRIPLNWIATAADKDAMITIDAGSASEVMTFRGVGGKF